jgi:lysyl-tRNA synthetase class 2
VGGWRPSASLEVLRLRARLLAEVRAFFAERGVLEVETPLLARAGVTDVHLASLVTRIAGQPAPFYLQTSPEYAMKRLLAAGSGDIYQVCKAFRDGEAGRGHNPEFTLIEWYRLGFDHYRLMDEVAALLSRLLGARLPEPPELLSYAGAFARVLGIDPYAAPLDALHAAAAARLGADLESLGAGRDTVLDLLMGALVGPALGRGRVTFVDEYPASQAALARLLPGTPPRAARFEAYVEGLELCNGFAELADAAEQRRRFAADRAARVARGLPDVASDERLLAALAAGLPDSAGVAVGFDRIVMLAGGLANIGEVLAFPVDDA